MSQQREMAVGGSGDWMAAIVLCLAFGIYFGLLMFRGWIPHDEGLLGQTAQRVLDGELPHRDFDDAYTGGLACLHAAAFYLGGVKLTTIRVVLFVFSTAFALACYRIALRVTTQWGAMLATALGVSWSVPNYFAALPSWYILFFATFGTLALLRYLETERKTWLFVAGLAGGLALTVKVVALYYIAAVLLFLLYRECSGKEKLDTESPTRDRRFLWFTLLVCTVFCGLLLVLIRKSLGLMAATYWLLPGVVLCFVIVKTEWQRCESDSFVDRFLRLLRSVLPFIGGVALPVGVFLIPYLATGSLGDLYHGVFVLPQRRLEEAAYALPPASSFLWSLPMIGLLLCGCYGRPRWEKVLVPLVIVLCTLALCFVNDSSADGNQSVYLAIWRSAYCLLPGAALIAGGWMVRRGAKVLSNLRQQQLFLILAMASLLNLVQFPYAFGVYFFYVAPLVVLLVHFFMAAQPDPPRMLSLCTAAFYLCFSLLWLNFGFPRSVGVSYLNLPQASLLDLPRGGLWVLKEDVDRYKPVIELIQRHSEEGSAIYATPDCPEIYFLSARRNPTRTMYDFFDEAEGRTERIIKLLDEERITVVVLNLMPEFSKPIDQQLLAAIQSRFPDVRRFDNFAVAWRDAPPDNRQ